MKRHPYVGLPKHQFWKRASGIEEPDAFDPVVSVPFRVRKGDKVVTAGSCFAQHVARHLRRQGYNYLVTERSHPIVPKSIAQEFGYGDFTARYGNLYTARQLKQLLARAFGNFNPRQVSWSLDKFAGVIDPFRPNIQPNGFLSDEELLFDREIHFAAVRRAIEAMDVFVFTLGLTECWEDAADGAIFPLAPGIAGGEYKEDEVSFRNFDESETASDLIDALKFIREINPSVKFILTVSPVPLNATMVDRHVYASTTWSKACLRIAAEKACNLLDDCTYFPSFEIITSPHSRGKYFDKDGRGVLEIGVEHVMGLFFHHFGGHEKSAVTRKTNMDKQDEFLVDMEKRIQLLCDEEMIGDV